MTSSRHLLVLLLSTWATVGCVAPSRTAGVLDRPAAAAVKEAPSSSIYLVRHGWHTGLALKRSEISTDDWPESLVFRDANHIEVGWGDEAYYREVQKSSTILPVIYPLVNFDTPPQG